MLTASVLFLLIFFPVLLLALASFLCLCAARVRHFIDSRRDAPVVVGFFHPYCHAGGGGERVLWCAIAALHARASAARVALDVVVYTGDRDALPRDIVARAAERFGVALPRAAEEGGVASPAAGARLRFVYLRSRALLEARLYPVLTLLGQSAGSVVVAAECLARARCDVWVDTTGAAFAYPLAAAGGRARVAAYVHYPTVSADMARAVASRAPAYNNAAAIARSPALTRAKGAYYAALAAAYGAAGRCAARGGVMANSSWTAAHVRTLWGPDCAVVFPPCPVADLADLPLPPPASVRAPAAPVPAPARARSVVSVAQFRPEKDHALQLRAFAAFRARYPKAARGVVLTLIGGARDAPDLARVEALRALAADLQCGDAAEFLVNAPYAEVRARLGAATAGLHTMRDEHFGIGVVEMQAAGVVVIAHDSGGPRSDIVAPAWRPGPGWGGAPLVGLLATSVDDYASALNAVFSGTVDAHAVTAAARAAAERFSDRAFAAGFLGHVWPLVCAAQADRAVAEGGAASARLGEGAAAAAGASVAVLPARTRQRSQSASRRR